jgi:hypothetical protein
LRKPVELKRRNERAARKERTALPRRGLYPQLALKVFLSKLTVTHTGGVSTQVEGLVHDDVRPVGCFQVEGIGGVLRTLRTDCLDRILILGRSHLEHVLRVYRRHYNEHRPHRALDLLPPNGRDPTPLNAPDRLQRRDLLGGLIHEYEAA